VRRGCIPLSSRTSSLEIGKKIITNNRPSSPIRLERNTMSRIAAELQVGPQVPARPKFRCRVTVKQRSPIFSLSNFYVDRRPFQ